MKADPLLDRIVINPRVMVGKPIVRGTRLTVEYILNLMAHGAAQSEILAEYDGLTRADLQACLLFAPVSASTLFIPLTLDLITNDKDFGERICRECHPHRGVVLLRLEDERAAVS